MKMKLFEEYSWDDEENDDLSATKESTQGESEKILSSMNTLDKLDKNFEKVYKNILNDKEDINVFSAKVQRMELNDLSKIISTKSKEDDLLSDYNDSREIKEDMQKLFNNESEDILKIFQDNNIQNNRKELYEMYDEVADINYIAYRMLRVYLDNILIKNVQNKDFIEVRENEKNLELNELESEEKDQVHKYIDMILVYFNIQNKLKNQIIPKMLKYGDFYIELVNLNPINNIIQKQPELLTESFEFNNKKYRNIKFALYESTIRKKIPLKNKEDFGQDVQESYSHLKDFDKFTHKLKKIKSNISKNRLIEEHDLSLFQKIEKEEFNIKDLFKMDIEKIEDIYLRLHEPSKVLKIEKDGVIYGYLVIEDLDEDQNGNSDEINIYKRFLSDSSGKSDENKGQAKEISDQISDQIIKKIGEDLDNFSFEDLNDELKTSLKIIIYHKFLKKQKIKFRFLDSSSLINFHTTIDKYAPYGTSIFDSIIQPVKMYTIGLMTSIVSRLSRASVVRKWNIEVGNRRNYQAVVEQVKKDLKDKAVSFDNLSNIKNITKMITDFKDIATVTRDGQRFIDLEILPMHDRSLPIQELQDLRQELISATGVPAVYLNTADSVDLRETLVNLNINFANTIISYQSFIEEGLDNLLNAITQKILELNGEDATDFFLTNYFKIHLNPPLVLQLQQNEALVGSVSNILGALAQAQMPVDPLKLFELYIPQVNWKKLKESGEELTREEVKKQMMQQGGGTGGM